MSEVRTRCNPATEASLEGYCRAKHSAHAEPRAAQHLLEQLSLVSDHEAIVQGPKKLNGFEGIGRGPYFNRLYQWMVS